jgi:hypothetical protein
MSNSEAERIQELLGDETSAFRAELAGLGFDALSRLKVAALIDADELTALVCDVLAEPTAGPFARELVIPAVKRVTSGLTARPETVGEALSPRGQTLLRDLVQSGKGPKGAWLAGAIAPDDLQKLIGPIVQDVLLKFVAKLPLPGISGGGGGPDKAGGGAGLLGMLGKQVQRSAGQLADVGKSVLGGLGGELERRVSASVRDFSQAAATDIRSAVVTRLRSDEGRKIVLHMRDGVLDRILRTPLAHVTTDLLRLPVDDVGELVIDTLDHLRTQPLFREVLAAEVRATVAVLGERTARDMLDAAGLLERARGLATKAVDPGLRQLALSAEFGDWVTRLLASARTP